MATKRSPNYGPGSISTVAKGRLANLKKHESGERKSGLMEMLSPDAKQIQNRVEMERMAEGNVRRGKK